MNFILFTALVNGTIAAVPSAPHGISVSSRSADYITVTWQQPSLVHPTDRLTYKYSVHIVYI